MGRRSPSAGSRFALGHRRAVEIFLCDAAFVVRAVEQRYLAVVDDDVRMMICGLGVRHQPIDERDGGREIVERVLLPDRATLDGPVLEVLQLPLDVIITQYGHLNTPRIAG